MNRDPAAIGLSLAFAGDANLDRKDRERAELLAALRRLLALHENAVFVCGTDDQETVDSVLTRAHAIVARLAP